MNIAILGFLYEAMECFGFVPGSGIAGLHMYLLFILGRGKPHTDFHMESGSFVLIFFFL